MSGGVSERLVGGCNGSLHVAGNGDGLDAASGIFSSCWGVGGGGKGAQEIMAGKLKHSLIGSRGMNIGLRSVWGLFGCVSGTVHT